MSNVGAQITGYMTLNKSSDLPEALKQKLLSAPEGQEARFQKKLYDLSVLSPELQALVLEEVATLKAAKEELPPKEKAGFNTGEVLLNGRCYLGGMKNGEPVKDKNGKEHKHSITSRIAFSVQGIERVLVDAKVAPKALEAETLEALVAALL